MITASGAEIAKAISKIIKIAPSATEAIFINAVSKKRIAVRGYHDNRYVTFLIDAVCEKPISFICAGDRLRAICDKRGDMTFTKSNKAITYKETGKSYAGTLEMSEIDVEFPKTELDNDNQLSDVLKSALITLSDKALLKSIYENRELFFFVKITRTLAVVAAGDRFHMAYCTAVGTKSKNDIEFVIPISYWMIVKNTFDIAKQAVSIKSTNNQVHIYNDDAIVTLPVMAVGDEDASLAIIEKAVTSDRKKLFEGQIDIDSVARVVTNMEAIKEKDRGLEVKFKAKNGLFQMTSETRHGAMKESIAVKTKSTKSATITLEASILQDILSKISGDVVLTIFEGSICRLEKDLSKEKSQIQYILLGLTT